MTNPARDSVIPHAAVETKRVAPDVIATAEQGPQSTARSNRARTATFQCPKGVGLRVDQCGISPALRAGVKAKVKSHVEPSRKQPPLGHNFTPLTAPDAGVDSGLLCRRVRGGKSESHGGETERGYFGGSVVQPPCPNLQWCVMPVLESGRYSRFLRARGRNPQAVKHASLEGDASLSARSSGNSSTAARTAVSALSLFHGHRGEIGKLHRGSKSGTAKAVVAQETVVYPSERSGVLGSSPSDDRLNHPQHAGRGSNSERQQERDGLSPIPRYQLRLKDWTFAGSREVATHCDVVKPSATVTFAERAGKTGYEPAENNCQVPRPFDFQ